MKIKKFNEKINELDPYGEEEWPDQPHWSIYDMYDSGMEGREHYHMKYILATSQKDAWNHCGPCIGANKIEHSKKDPNSKNFFDRIRVTDEEENYKMEKKKLEKKFNEAKKILDNFNEVYNEWKSKNKKI